MHSALAACIEAAGLCLQCVVHVMHMCTHGVVLLVSPLPLSVLANPARHAPRPPRIAPSSTQDVGEHAMVRHEAAEALGAIANSATVKLLKEFTNDAEPIVAHSCVVALDMLEYEQSGAFDYASKGGDAAAAAAAPAAAATAAAAGGA